MKTNIFIPVVAAGILLMCGVPAVEGGEGFGFVIAPAASVAQEATTIMTPDVAGTTTAIGPAFAIGKDPASPAVSVAAATTPINPNTPGDDHYTTSGSRYGANTNAMISTVIPVSASSSGKSK